MLVRRSYLFFIRKSIHIASGFLGTLNIFHNFIPIYIAILGLLLGAILSIIVNYDLKILSFLHKYKGQKEIYSGQGPLSLLLAYTILHIIAILYPELRDLTLASMLIVTVGDSLASIIGKSFNYYPLFYNKDKNWIGLIFGIISSIASIIFFIPFIHAVISSLLAMILESLDLKIAGYKIEDNLLIPAVSFISLYFLYSIQP
jgi:dolichol kinase